MSSSVFEAITSLKDVQTHAGIDQSEFNLLDFSLPTDHQVALRESNGVEVYGGYVRLFGINTINSIDALRWNDESFWKFAWNDRCSEYWCFAETAWGDQYAYNKNEVYDKEQKVYLLDGLSMTPTQVASSFSEFLYGEFFRSAKEPYDIMMTQARENIGDLDINTNLVYTPSILLGGIEDISRVQKMDARSAMICNGDIAIQLDSGPPDGMVQNIMPYEDAEKRMRLQIIWRGLTS